MLACGAGLTIHHARAGRLKIETPRILGHEITAEIVAVGAGVTDLKAGDAVTAYFYLTCGECHWCRIDRETLAVVLRDFPLRDTDDFARMVDHFPSPEFGYSGGAAQRNNLKGKVFETTHAAAHTTLVLHQEMSYLPHYPRQLAFFCQHAADTGGETWIGDMRRAQPLMPQKFLEEVRRRGIMYTRNWRAPGTRAEHPLIEQQHRTWHESFYTTDRSKAEEACRGMGVEQRALRRRAQQLLVRMLAMDIRQPLGSRLQLGQGGRGTIDIGAGTAGAVHHAAQQAGAIGHVEIQRMQDR